MIDLPDGSVVQIGSPRPPVVYAAPPQAASALVMPTPGIPGLPGASGAPGDFSITRTAAVTVSGHKLVVPNDIGQLVLADPNNLVHINRPVWLTTSSITAGASGPVTAMGVVIEPTWSWSPGYPLYLGVGGTLTQTLPSTVFLRIVGTVIAPTVISYNPQPPLLL